MKYLFIALFAILASCGSGESSESEQAWSQSAITSSQTRIADWTAHKYVTIDTDRNKAYIDPAFWQLSGAKEKEEILMTIIIYADTQTGQSNSFFDYYDKTSSKQIASWSKISGFNFEY